MKATANETTTTVASVVLGKRRAVRFVLLTSFVGMAVLLQLQHTTKLTTLFAASFRDQTIVPDVESGESKELIITNRPLSYDATPTPSSTPTNSNSGEGTTDSSSAHIFNSTSIFSACLKIKDDNHWLVEWLAYHYHVLPLRNLIVFKDPNPQTSPDAILERWRPHLNYLQVWDSTDDVMVWNSSTMPKISSVTNNTDVNLHRQRQNFFYSQCLSHLKEQQAQTKATWVMLTDTDEFVRPNSYVLKDDSPDLRQPGCVARLLDAKVMAHTEAKRAQQNEDADQNVRKASRQQHDLKCIHIPRFLMINREALDNQVQSDIPHGFNGTALLTTRWLYRSKMEVGLGKNIVHVGNLDLSELSSGEARGPHTVLPGPCPSAKNRLRDQLYRPDAWLLIQHYMGTLEQYTFRDDPRNYLQKLMPRRTKWLNKQRQYQHKRKHNATSNHTVPVFDDALRPWLRGFVENVGLEEALRLLNGVGDVRVE